MLEDRDYMRDEFHFRPSWNLRWPLSLVLIIVLVVSFALQQIDIAYFGSRYLYNLMLVPGAVQHGYLWQLLTFQFLHANIWHLLFNVIGIFFFGPPVEQRLGKKHFLLIYFGGGIAGGLLHTLLATVWPMHFGTPVLGASAGICSLIAAFCLMNPEDTILIYFFPVRAKYLLYFEGGIALFFTLVPSDRTIAYTAHLGGLLFAIGYMRWVIAARHDWPAFNPFKRKEPRITQGGKILQPLSKLRRQPRAEEPAELPSEEFISSQVDPILDKISASGIQSLTERERQILQAARAKMSKR